MSAVRIAGLGDREGMLGFLREMHAENGVVKLTERKMIAALDAGLTRNHSIIGVIGEPGAPRASVGLFVNSFWYSDDQHLEDFWCFVSAQHRRSTYAKDLLTFAKHASDLLEIPLLMGVLSTERTEAKVKLYERSLPFAGAAFLYNGPPILKAVA